MEIDVQPLPGNSNVTCVAVDGRIDSYTVDRVEEELNSLIRIGSSRLICDLSGVEFVSSSGFKAFQRIMKFAREQDGDLKFCRLTPEVGRLFTTVGFAKDCGVFGTREEAVTGFSRDGNQAGGTSREGGSGLNALRRIIGFGREPEPEEKAPESRKPDSTLLRTQIFKKDSSLQETVIFKSPAPAEERPPEPGKPTPARVVFEPVKMTIQPDAEQFQNLSQLLGTIGALVEFPSEGLVKLNVAVQELCRTMVKELGADESFAMEIDSLSPGFRVAFDIPREDFNICEHLQPKPADTTLTESVGREWLLKYVDDVEAFPTESGTRVLISLRS